MKELRCGFCGKKLGEYKGVIDDLKIKCRCGKINDIKKPDELNKQKENLQKVAK